MLQFLAPTLQFLIAVLIYGEPFTRAHAVAFAAIWTALALYVGRDAALAAPPATTRMMLGARRCSTSPR